MRKKLLIVLAVFLVLVIGFVGFVAMRPADFRIVRSTTISAPPADVFPQVNDFHNWNNWSPWAKIDPNMKAVYEGPESGEGAVYKWFGNDDVGEGIMQITESKPDEEIKIRLEFIKPFAGLNTTLFTFKPEGDKTVVTWDMSGKNPFLGKLFHLIMDMDKMVGDQFEKGLAQMKSVVETKKTE